MNLIRKIPRVLLVNPWIYDFAAYDSWVKPLGLLYLAALLRKNGFEVCFVDCLNTSDHQAMLERGIKKKTLRRHGTGHFYKEHVEKPESLANIPRRYSRYGISPDLFEKILQKIPRPDVILVTSMMTYWYPGVFHAVRLLRKHCPEVPVILGGIYATLCPEHAMQNAGAHFYIRGEGEVSVLKMVSGLTGHDISYLPNLDDLDSLGSELLFGEI